MTINRAFGTTFGIAVVVEFVRLALPSGSIIEALAFWGGYILLAILGFLLAAAGHSYKTAFANTWPFVIFWLVFGLITITFDPRGWPPGLNTPENVSNARWGYVLATVLFLPLAFLAAALGVLAARTVRRFTKVGSDAP